MEWSLILHMRMYIVYLQEMMRSDMIFGIQLLQKKIIVYICTTYFAASKIPVWRVKYATFQTYIIMINTRPLQFLTT